ncbi:unnamed protein product, partial [Owenia fusiformis]
KGKVVMAAPSSIQDGGFRDILKCAVCKDRFDNPRLLPCNHLFCLGCIDRLVGKSEPSEPLHCPVCGRTWHVPHGGTTALKANSLLEIAQSAIPNSPATSTDSPIAQTCQEHPCETLVLFCTDDNSLVCLSCLPLFHNGHNFLEINQAADGLKQEVEIVIDEYLSSLPEDDPNRIKEEINSLEHENQTLVQQLNENRSHIKEAKLLTPDVNHAFHTWKNKIDEYHHNEVKSKLSQIDDIQISRALVESFVTHIRTLEDDIEITRQLLAVKEQGLPIPVYLPSTHIVPLTFQPCVISGNSVRLGSISRREAPSIVLSFENDQDDINESMSMSSNVERMSVSSIHEPMMSVGSPYSNPVSSPGVCDMPTTPGPITQPSRYLPRPQLKRTIKLTDESSVLEWINDLAVVGTSSLAAVRCDAIQFFNNSWLIKTVHIKMYCVASTPDNCYAFTNGTGTISIYTQGGEHRRDINTSFTRLYGIEFSGGELVVADGRAKSVSFIDYQTGEVVKTTPGELFQDSSPCVAVRENNNVVISDLDNNCVTVIDRDGRKLMQYGSFSSDGGPPSWPRGICTDGDHTIVADNVNHRVSLVSPSGVFLRHLISMADGMFLPYAVVIDHKGHLLVGCDKGNLFEVKFKE